MTVSDLQAVLRRSANLFAGAALVLVTLVFAFLRLSEPSADPDLWGHVLYGQRHLFSGALDRFEPFSWSAPGAPWINHEIGAEWIMAVAHVWGGAHGLWLLMVLVGAVTLVVVGWEGSSRVAPAHRWMVWAIIGLASREVALGFAMRPQIFSSLLWVLFLVAIRCLGAGRRWPVVGIPVLCAVWINIHGGVLLAVVVMLIVTVGSMFVALSRRSGWGRAVFARWTDEAGWRDWSWHRYAITGVLSATALLMNPYGWRLPAWLIESVTYTRPEISEWNPTSFGAAHAIFWFLAFVWGVALVQRSARVPGWEAIVGSLVLVAAIRHERHVPLFALTMMAFLPGCFSRWTKARRAPKISMATIWLIAVVLAAAGGLGATRIIGAMTGPFAGRMQVSPGEYPIDALQYVRAAGLRGNAVIYFDWAQQALWELPDSRVSFDGRLDTCYPRELIAEHWDFFHRGILPVRTFSLRESDWMLLPRGGDAVMALEAIPSWRRVYMDAVAEVFVNSERVTVPAAVDKFEALGWQGGPVSFPDRIPARAAKMRTQ